MLHFELVQGVCLNLKGSYKFIPLAKEISAQPLIDTGMWSLVFKHMKTYEEKYNAEEQKYRMY